MSTQLLTTSVGLLVLVGSLSAVGAAAPPDVSTSDATDATVGPADGLPEPGPDFVGDLLGSISDFVASVDGDSDSAASNSIQQILPGALNHTR